MQSIRIDKCYAKKLFRYLLYFSQKKCAICPLFLGHRIENGLPLINGTEWINYSFHFLVFESK